MAIRDLTFLSQKMSHNACKRPNLTMSWPLGTFRSAKGGEYNDKIGACPTNRLAKPPPLSARRGEPSRRDSWRNHKCHGDRRPCRTTRFWRLFSQESAGPDWP